MKLQIKRLLCLVIALCMLVFVMSACGGKKTETTQSNNSTSSKDADDTVIAVDPDIDPNSKYADPD